MRSVSLPSTKASKMRSIIRRSARSRSISAFKSFLTVFRCGSYVQISPSRDAHLEHGCLPSHCNGASCQLFLPTKSINMPVGGATRPWLASAGTRCTQSWSWARTNAASSVKLAPPCLGIIRIRLFGRHNLEQTLI